MASFTGDVTLSIQGSYVGSNDLSTLTQSIALKFAQAFTSGTGNDQANVFWSDTRTIAASGSETLDLYGSLTDAFGTTVNLATVKALYIHASSGNTNNVVVGGGDWTAIFDDATDQLVLPPDAVFMICHPNAGYTVTDSTGDGLLITNSGAGTGVTYDIAIVGTSA